MCSPDLLDDDDILSTEGGEDTTTIDSMSNVGATSVVPILPRPHYWHAIINMIVALINLNIIDFVFPSLSSTYLVPWHRVPQHR